MSNDGRTRKVYGWTENSNTITYIYAPDDDTPAEFMVMPKPELIITGSERNKKYEYSTGGSTRNTRGYRYSNFYPAGVYVTRKRLNNICIVAPCLCYRTDENGQVYINSYLST